jgi:hypothetical protein
MSSILPACLLACLLVTVVSGVVVNTPRGALRGITTTHEVSVPFDSLLNSSFPAKPPVVVDTFYNIPYAKPPVGTYK